MIDYVIYKMNGEIAFISKIKCADDASETLKKRLAVLCAMDNGIYVKYSNLTDHELKYSCLSGDGVLWSSILGADIEKAKIEDLLKYNKTLLEKSK